MSVRVHETNRGLGFPGSSFRYTPLRHVRVLFVSFVQGLFSEAPPGNYRWSPDSELTEIVVRDEAPIRVDLVGTRPAVNFTMGTVSFYSLGMDDMYSQDFDVERKVKVVLVPGTMNINVCSRVDVEAHDLAWVIAEHVWLLRELLIKAGFFETGRGISISPPSPPGSIVVGDSADEWFCSTVSIPFQFNRKSAFTQLGRRIVSGIETTVNVNTSPIEQGRGGPALANNEFPVVSHTQFPPPFAPNASDVYGKTPDPAGTRTYSLPVAPHPLNPSKLVVVETVRPWRASAPKRLSRGVVFP